jgi:hypothetical protein
MIRYRTNNKVNVSFAVDDEEHEQELKRAITEDLQYYIRLNNGPVGWLSHDNIDYSNIGTMGAVFSELMTTDYLKLIQVGESTPDPKSIKKDKKQNPQDTSKNNEKTFNPQDIPIEAP